MSVRTDDCKACGKSSDRIICNRCGTDVTLHDDAVRVMVHRVASPGQRSNLDYCNPCAAEELPRAVGIAPGSDLPAELHPREA